MLNFKIEKIMKRKNLNFSLLFVAAAFSLMLFSCKKDFATNVGIDYVPEPLTSMEPLHRPMCR